MSTRTFALIFGIVFLAAGCLGFVPGVSTPLHADHPAVVGHGGQLLGLFPVNELHNGVHLLFGLWGLIASRSLAGSVLYARGVALAYLLLTLCGFVPGLDNLFGYVPLYGNDIWLHALLGLVAAYFGWAHRSPVTA